MPDPAISPTSDPATLGSLQESYRQLLDQIGKVIIGQEEAIDQIMISLLSNGHVLLVGVPGLAKTMLIRTLAQSLDLRFNRATSPAPK
jgi:MoxR-like ATPase